jgi:BirA family transcriptional regulator, biotin operon repressor / biotin---[acetyl-CoA-carboxylase] ligase
VKSPRETWQFPTRHIGKRVWVFDCLPSTNDHAAAQAHAGFDPGLLGGIVLAEQQTQGRGQHGRSWQSRPGSSILCSILLKARSELSRPVILTAWVAVAVRETVHKLIQRPVQIKWPNDVLVDGKKICGILIEQSRIIVVGLGLNLNQSREHFASAGLPDATSLGILTGQDPTIPEVLPLLVDRLDYWYTNILETNMLGFQQEWVAGMGILHQTVCIECTQGETIIGRVREMSFDALELELGDGAFRVLQPEDISHVFTI